MNKKSYGDRQREKKKVRKGKREGVGEREKEIDR